MAKENGNFIFDQEFYIIIYFINITVYNLLKKGRHSCYQFDF